MFELDSVGVPLLKTKVKQRVKFFSKFCTEYNSVDNILELNFLWE